MVKKEQTQVEILPKVGRQWCNLMSQSRGIWLTNGVARNLITQSVGDLCVYILPANNITNGPIIRREENTSQHEASVSAGFIIH